MGLTSEQKQELEREYLEAKSNEFSAFIWSALLRAQLAHEVYDAADLTYQQLQGVLVTACRRRRDLSIRDLSKLSKLSVGAISNVENGRTNPHPRTIQDLARALKVPEWQLEPESALDVPALAHRWAKRGENVPESATT
jgi:DNA-binding transcriptional regulator YiaG